MYKLIGFLFLSLLVACSSAEDSERKLIRKDNRVGSGIFRSQESRILLPSKLEHLPSPGYPWKPSNENGIRQITIEHFRCKGSPLNPRREVLTQGESQWLVDCNGGSRHSLPIVDNQEHIYPILIELLNYLQKKNGKKVHILSGHRCPKHNEYIDESKYNATSKHMVGAEVAFRVDGFEGKETEIVEQLIKYYKNDKEGSAYQDFTRYTKPDTNVSTFPWMNKEIFIKLYEKNEGRSLEIPPGSRYISVQVRFDRKKQARVIYSWDKAHQSFFRY